MTDAPCSPPVYITLGDMPELFGMAKQTTYRWNASGPGRKRQLPVPDKVVRVTPMWEDSTLLEWAESRSMLVNEAVLARIRLEQGA